MRYGYGPYTCYVCGATLSPYDRIIELKNYRIRGIFFKNEVGRFHVQCARKIAAPMLHGAVSSDEYSIPIGEWVDLQLTLDEWGDLIT